MGWGGGKRLEKRSPTTLILLGTLACIAAMVNAQDDSFILPKYQNPFEFATNIPPGGDETVFDYPVAAGPSSVDFFIAESPSSAPSSFRGSIGDTSPSASPPSSPTSLDLSSASTNIVGFMVLVVAGSLALFLA